MGANIELHTPATARPVGSSWLHWQAVGALERDARSKLVRSDSVGESSRRRLSGEWALLRGKSPLLERWRRGHWIRRCQPDRAVAGGPRLVERSQPPRPTPVAAR